MMSGASNPKWETRPSWPQLVRSAAVISLVEADGNAGGDGRCSNSGRRDVTQSVPSLAPAVVHQGIHLVHDHAFPEP